MHSTERNEPGPQSVVEAESAAPDHAAEMDANQPSRSGGAPSSPRDSSSGPEAEQSDVVGQNHSRLLKAVAIGTAGAARGGVAGTLVGWGGVGVAAAGGSVGLPVVVPVAVGAAAGVGVVVAAKALREPVDRASVAVRDKFADAERETSEGDAPREAEAASVVNSGGEDAKSQTSQASVAAGSAAGAAAAVAGVSLITKLRRRVFKNAKPGSHKSSPRCGESPL